MSHRTFCTVFDCMDGRCQDVVGKWAKKEFDADFADTITIAGLDGMMLKDENERARAMNMAGISAEKHGAKKAAVVGHTQCAGYPASDDEHRAAIKKSAQLVKDSGMFDEVAGLFVKVEDGSVEEVCRV